MRKIFIQSAGRSFAFALMETFFIVLFRFNKLKLRRQIGLRALYLMHHEMVYLVEKQFLSLTCRSHSGIVPELRNSKNRQGTEIVCIN